MARRLLVPAVAALALVLGGCGGEETTGREGADRTNGKELFLSGADGNPSCASCHSLADAGTVAQVGPDLDQALGYSCEQGFAESTRFDVVLRQIDLARGAMPPDVVTGQDAVDVAAYVASVAGATVEGCEPSGGGGAGTTTAETSG